MRSILSLFGKSPFEPLREHVEKVNEGVQLLDQLFRHLINKEIPQLKNTAKQISDFENEADLIKNDLREHLPRTLLLPVSRSDLLVLLDVQDGIADTAQDIGVLLSVYQPDLPVIFHEDLMNLVKYAVRSIAQVRDIYQNISNLINSTFRGAAAEQVFESIKKIGNTEHKADKTALGLLQKLFNSTELVYQDFIMMDKVMIKLGHIADLGRKTSNRLRIILSH